MADIETASVTWTPPVYDIQSPPRLYHETKVSAQEHNFARRAKWCPDGSVALAQCENASFEYLSLPQDNEFASESRKVSIKTQRLQQPSPALDFVWYPFATTQDPASFCFVTSVRECPVHLLDAADGRLRASYKIVDHRERQVAPHSLAFNPTGTKLYCGFEDAIEVFDLHVPGVGTRLHTTPNRKSRDGLKGIISSLAFSSDASSGVFAAGTFSAAAPSSSNVALFSESTGQVPVMYVGDERDTGYGIRASVSQLQFNPFRPYLLYASFRRHRSIYSWDLRGDVTKPVQMFVRPLDASRSRRTETNQRLRFDIDISGKWLAVGDHDGDISVFDLSKPEESGESTTEPVASDVLADPALQFHAHDDAVGSVGFHPLRPLLLSVSGSRHFTAGLDEGSDASSDSDESEENDEGEPPLESPVRRPIQRPRPTVRDASAKLWDFSKGVSGAAVPEA